MINYIPYTVSLEELQETDPNCLNISLSLRPIEDQLIETQEIQILKNLIAESPARVRFVLNALYYEEQKQIQIARKLKISPAAVSQMLKAFYKTAATKISGN